MQDHWYVQFSGREIGPVSSAKLRELALRSKITSDSLIRKGAQGNWVSASRVRGLFPPERTPDEPGTYGVDKREINRASDGMVPVATPVSDRERPAVVMQPLAEEARSAARFCPFCTEVIAADAKKCKHCGEYLDPVLREQQTLNALARSGASRTVASPGVAGLLSFLVPGLGQIYREQVGKGIAWFVVVLIGYAALIVPGLVLHLYLHCRCGVQRFRAQIGLNDAKLPLESVKRAERTGFTR